MNICVKIISILKTVLTMHPPYLASKPHYVTWDINLYIYIYYSPWFTFILHFTSNWYPRATHIINSSTIYHRMSYKIYMCMYGAKPKLLQLLSGGLNVCRGHFHLENSWAPGGGGGGGKYSLTLGPLSSRHEYFVNMQWQFRLGL